MKRKKVLLTILDGWGLGNPSEYNAIANARTPNFDRLTREYPNTSLKSDGLAVGLPDGQFGTSEVNHLTIGSGRIIFQDLPKINNSIASGEFDNNPAILKIITHAHLNNSKIHLVGILSDGGVHSHIKHLKSILKLINKLKFKGEVSLHLFTDGRDVAPKSAEKYFTQLEDTIKKLDINCYISTVQGRSFLDRDRDWNRTEVCFNLIRKAEGYNISDWRALLNLAYTTIHTDEQIGQFVLNKKGVVRENDSIFFFHLRTDRIYQIIKRFFNENLKNTMIGSFCQPSSEEFTKLEVAFPREYISDTLAETISKNNFSQIHIAETEKFPHITYFFNGERDTEFSKEEWKLHESNRFIKPYYDIEPSMKNFEITSSIIEAVNSQKYDFILANYSSPDMVGHTGNYHACVVSAESVDFCLGKIYEVISKNLDDFCWIITADHGNSEHMWDLENNQPHTQHTLSKVPFILVSDLDCKLDRRESLEDIAPTILDLMKIEKPVVMTGNSLILKKNPI